MPTKKGLKCSPASAEHRQGCLKYLQVPGNTETGPKEETDYFNYSIAVLSFAWISR